MNNRTAAYLKRRRAANIMQHPTDLKTFLKAELDLCDSRVVKKHILQTLEQLEQTTVATGSAQ
jgi:hypothetical protein